MKHSKTRYSDAFKEQALAKVYSRGSCSIQAIADELNLSVHTLKTWMSHTAANDKNRAQSPAKRPQDWSAEHPEMADRLKYAVLTTDGEISGLA